jgi:uncharacterized protein (TIGR03067 family)
LHAEDNKKDQEKLQGKWSVVSAERDGQAHDKIKDDKLVIASDRITITKASGNEEPAVTFTLDATKKPKHIDVMVSGMTMQAIYELDGDNLKLCFARPGAERPGDFTTKAGSERMLVVLKRDK